MREGWKEVRLKDICTSIQYGYTESAQKEKVGPKFLRITDIVGESISWDNVPYCTISAKDLEKYKLSKGDIVVARTGNTTGYAKLIRNNIEAVFASYLIRFKINESIADSDFIGRLVESEIFKSYVWSIIGGSAQPGANAKLLGGFPIHLPPLSTQRKIASILSRYDDMIENNMRRIRLLEESAQLTYEEWFVRMRYPGYEDAVMNEESGLPEGWERVKIGDVCKVAGGGTPSKVVSEYWDNGTLMWFSPTDLSKSGSLIQLDSSSKITELGLKKSSAKLMQPDSFMMTSRATIGLFGIIDKPFTTNQGFINVTPVSSYHKEYLIYNFKSNQQLFINHATGATFLEISRSVFKKIKITWPNESLIKTYHSIVSDIHKEMLNLSKQNQLLKEARDILLPRLMLGVVDVEV